MSDRAGPRAIASTWTAPRRASVRAQVDALDQAAYDAVADTPTPSLDRFLLGVSRSADHSRLWMVIAASLALLGGWRGRRAAVLGMLAVGAAPAAWIPLHLAAALVGYSRVHTGVHDPSDVSVGAVVGVLCGWTVRRFAGPVSSASDDAGRDSCRGGWTP